MADRLESYRRKRDFRRTPEPDPGKSDAPRGGSDGRVYTIQKHAATRLHFDLRLEHDGALLSWAIAKGPSLDPADKRLAVRTEDHPLDYATFEGTIPEDEYGGGTVMLWDRGTWKPDGDPDAGLEEGKLAFRLDGERLRGAWALVRMKPRKGRRDSAENWLLVKERDDLAAEGEASDPVKRWTTSVATGRTMDEIAAARDDPPDDAADDAGTGDASGRKPVFVAPQLATLVAAAPEGEEWLHEIKYDGYRIVVVKADDGIRVFTRSGKDWTDRFPAIAQAVGSLPADTAVLDGEAVAFDEDGRTDFSRLQAAFESGETIAAAVFDLLHLDGTDLRDRPLRERKDRLKRLMDDPPPPLGYSDHIDGEGPDVLSRACALGAEGIVSKRRNARYRSGRSRAWLKSKCVLEEEMVVGGYSPSSVKGKPFASLLLGTFEDERLVYRGRVGSGFDEATSDRLAGLLDRRARKTSPFSDLPREVARDARFVTPDLVAEVRYQELTAAGLVRHATFRGLREDKPARAVSRSAERGEGAGREGSGRDGAGGARKGGEAAVKLTHPDKVLYPVAGLTKRALADHYATVAEGMLPHLAGRPVSLVRCPDGRDGECFFQKHRAKGMPAALRPVEIEESDGERATYVLIEDAEGLAAAAQVGALELHVWGAPADRPDRPDRLVLDLDPGEGLAFADVRDAAREVRDVLGAAGLESFPLLTGGKGIHVIVPLAGDDDWDRVKAFARAAATALARADPDRYVAKAAKSARKGRIFVDWLRNTRGATAIVPLSPRARRHAPVATPLRWDELGRVESADAYTVDAIPRRLSHLKTEPWAGFEDARATIGADRLAAMEREAGDGKG